MPREGLVLTRTQAQTILALFLVIFIASFFLGYSMGRTRNLAEKETAIINETSPDRAVSSGKPSDVPPTPEPRQTESYFSLVLGWESDISRAEKLRDRFIQKGLQGVRVLENPGNNKVRYRIILGKFVTKEDAAKFKQDYVSAKKIPEDAWILNVSE